MWRVLICLVFASLLGCVAHPKRPYLSPVWNLPYGGISGFQSARFLRYEHKDIGLDGGSHVYVLSDDKNRKYDLWDLCPLAKEEKYLDLAKNAFFVKVGEKQSEFILLPAGSDIEAHLIAILKTGLRQEETFSGQHYRQLLILEGIRDRSLRIPYQEEPNKAPEPTPRPVTIRAEPRIAPVRAVAHL
jgi:hypothetical protein